MGRALHASLCLRALSMAALLVGPIACGETAPMVQPQTVVDILHQMSDKADVIFAGEVLAIRRPNDGVVEVAFRVDEAIRGCTNGSTYILREWAGLWIGNNQRYRVGEHRLMLLHAPSAAGMSSPVGGLDGAIPILQGGSATTPSDVVTPVQPPVVDLRWLGVRLTRAVLYSNEDVHARPNGLQTRTDVRQQTMSMAEGGSTTVVAPLTPMVDSSSSTPGSVPAQQASVDAVIGMLTAWQKAQHVAP